MKSEPATKGTPYSPAPRTSGWIGHPPSSGPEQRRGWGVAAAPENVLGQGQSCPSNRGKYPHNSRIVTLGKLRQSGPL